MSQKGLRRWAWLGALVSAVLSGSACSRGETVTGQEKTRAIPKEGTRDEGLANTGQPLESFGQQQGTGGAGQQGQQGPQWQQPQQVPQIQQKMTLEQAQQKPPDQAWGAQGKEGGIGAPGYSTPQVPVTLGSGTPLGH